MSQKISNEEIRSYISEIVTGQKIKEVRTSEGHETLLFRVPFPIVKQKADLFYRKVLSEAKSAGVPSKAKMEEMIKKYGIVDTDLVDYQIEQLEKKLEKEKTIMIHSRHPKQIAEKKRMVEALTSEINQQRAKKNQPFWSTAETKAEQSRTLFLISEGVFNLDGQKYWASLEEFLEERDVEMQANVISEYVQYAEGYPTSTIRAIARSHEWAIYWRSAKSTGSQVFQNPVTEWDINKLLLVHWAQFYEDVMSSPEAPSENIIENDIELDKWLKDRRVISDRNRDKSVTTTADGKIKTTYNVNQPYKLVTQKEMEALKQEDSLNG